MMTHVPFRAALLAATTLAVPTLGMPIPSLARSPCR